MYGTVLVCCQDRSEEGVQSPAAAHRYCCLALSTCVCSSLPAVVLSLIRSRLLPYDRSGVYLILAAPDVRLVSPSGKPSAGCGTHLDLGPTRPLRIAYARNPVQDPGCIFSPDAR